MRRSHQKKSYPVVAGITNTISKSKKTMLVFMLYGDSIIGMYTVDKYVPKGYVNDA